MIYRDKVIGQSVHLIGQSVRIRLPILFNIRKWNQPQLLSMVYIYMENWNVKCVKMMVTEKHNDLEDLLLIFCRQWSLSKRTPSPRKGHPSNKDRIIWQQVLWMPLTGLILLFTKVRLSNADRIIWWMKCPY